MLELSWNHFKMGLQSNELKCLPWFLLKMVIYNFKNHVIYFDNFTFNILLYLCRWSAPEALFIYLFWDFLKARTVVRPSFIVNLHVYRVFHGWPSFHGQSIMSNVVCHDPPWCLPSFPRSTVLFYGLLSFLCLVVYKPFLDAFFNRIHWFSVFWRSIFCFLSISYVKMKHKASRKPVQRTPPASAEMFIPPGSKQIFDNVYSRSKSSTVAPWNVSSMSLLSSPSFSTSIGSPFSASLRIYMS